MSLRNRQDLFPSFSTSFLVEEMNSGNNSESPPQGIPSNSSFTSTVSDEARPKILVRRRTQSLNPAGAALPPPHASSSLYITDILVLPWGERPPPGQYFPLKHLGDSIHYTLNKGYQIFVERCSDKLPITSVCLFYPNKGEFLPPGFVLVEHHSRHGKGPVDFHVGCPKNLSVHLGYAKSIDCASPIVDLGLWSFASSSSSFPHSWTLVERTPLGFKANLAGKLVSGTASQNKLCLSLCIRVDCKDVSKFTAADMHEAGSSDEEETLDVDTITTAAVARKSKGRMMSGLFSPSSFGRRSSLLPLPPPATSAAAGVAPSRSNTTALERAREKALWKANCNEGLGMDNLSFNPSVAALLVPRPVSEQIFLHLHSICRGPLVDASKALFSLSAMLGRGEITPPSVFSEQMSVLDFVIAYGANSALERGVDALIAPSAKLVVESSSACVGGFHPVTLHFSLSILFRAHEFFALVKDGFNVPRITTPIPQGKITPPSSTTSAEEPPSPPFLFSRMERSISSDRLQRLFRPSSSHQPSSIPTTSSAAAAMTPTHSSDLPLAHDLAVDLFTDRRFVLVHAVHTLFQHLLDRCAAYLDHTALSKLDHVVVNEVFERVGDLVASGALFSQEESLEVHLALLKVFSTSSPLVDLLFALAWLCNYYSSTNVDSTSSSSSSLLRDFLISCQHLQSASVYLVVRRLVFPMVMRKFATMDNKGHFEENLQMLQVLWMHYRMHLKAEFCMAFHCVLIPALVKRNDKTLMVLELISNWLETPNMVVEILFNLETDSPIPTWKPFSELMDVLCGLASNGPTPSTISTGDDAVRLLALHTLVTVARHLVNLSGTVCLTKKEGFFVKTEEEKKARKNQREEEKRVLEQALKNGSSGSARSAIKYMLASGYLQETPAAVVQFLHVHLVSLGESSVGDYLGEGGRTPEEEVFMNSVRDLFVKNTQRVGTDSLDRALRRFLTGSGFRLPGEAQKIERLLDAFSRRYAQDHPELDMSEESVLLLTFALVMLNTDLHKPQIKASKKMKKPAFCRNLRGQNGGKDFPLPYLEKLYDSIAREQIKLDFVVSSPTASSATPAATTLVTPPIDSSTQILRGLTLLASKHEDTFAYESSLALDCAQTLFDLLAPKFFQLATHLLEENAFPDVFALALDLVEYALTVTVFLNLPFSSERRAFSVLYHKRLPRAKQVWMDDVFAGYSFDENTVGTIVAELHGLHALILETRLEKAEQHKLFEISQELQYPLLCNSVSRTFLRSGAVLLKTSPLKSTKKPKKRHLYLFSDCLLLVAVLANHKHCVESNLTLKTVRVFDVLEDETIDKLWFEVRSPLGGSFFIHFSNGHEKETWHKDMLEAIQRCCTSTISFPSKPPSPSTSSSALRPSPPPVSNRAEKESSTTVAANDFSHAVLLAKRIIQNPDLGPEIKLLVYGFFKQATLGDCMEEAHAQLAASKRAKLHAWRAHFGASKEEAKAGFLRVVHSSVSG